MALRELQREIRQNVAKIDAPGNDPSRRARARDGASKTCRGRKIRLCSFAAKRRTRARLCRAGSSKCLSGPDRPEFKIGSGRLELASAITSKNNPLTARVMINRIWLHHFGEGFVTTPDDFGTMSEAPSHPELLDYLASRFMDDGWSMKKMHKLIMTLARVSAEQREQSALRADRSAQSSALAREHSPAGVRAVARFVARHRRQARHKRCMAARLI